MEDTLNLCAGEIVEVLSKQEILATLDRNGRHENLPFMPEMFQYCGQRLRVHKRAHKTCDFVTNTCGRSLPNAVHLEDVRCDGAAHGGCQAQCMIFWKEAWLKRVPDQSLPATSRAIPVNGGSTGGSRNGGSPAGSPNGGSRGSSVNRGSPWTRDEGPCSERMVVAACIATPPGSPEAVYSCQATLLPDFTKPLSGWDIRQYIEDYQSGNVRSLGRMLPRFIYRTYDNLIDLGLGWGPILRWFYDQFQKIRRGRPYPARAGSIAKGSPTPTCATGLQPGELVKVKSYEAILKTLDTATKNRGMAFSAEMVPYCDRVFRVMSRVTRIVDEKTGKMLNFKNPCIILEGGVCQALYNKNMIFCPRATYAYWREIWLDRVADGQDPARVECGG